METENSKMFKINLMSSYSGSEAWDECDYGQIVAILISYNSSDITSLRFLYVKDKIFRMSEQHGRLEGSSRMIILDYPTEFLTAMHGYRMATVTSITFVTNKATYGPFGKTRHSMSDYNFELPLRSEVGWFNGFFGTVYNGCIGSIGIYMTPTLTEPKSSGQVKLEYV